MSPYDAHWAAEILFYLIPCPQPDQHIKTQNHSLTWLLNLFRWKGIRYFSPSFCSWRKNQFEPSQLVVVVVSGGLTFAVLLGNVCSFCCFWIIAASTYLLLQQKAFTASSLKAVQSFVLKTELWQQQTVTGRNLAWCCFYTQVTLLALLIHFYKNLFLNFLEEWDKRFLLVLAKPENFPLSDMLSVELQCFVKTGTSIIHWGEDLRSKRRLGEVLLPQWSGMNFPYCFIAAKTLLDPLSRQKGIFIKKVNIFTPFFFVAIS